MSRPRTSFYIRGPKIGPVHTIFHLGSIGTGSRKTSAGRDITRTWKAIPARSTGANTITVPKRAATKCANSKATQQAALAAFARLDQQAASAQGQGRTKGSTQIPWALLEPFINMSGKEKTMKTRSRMIAGGTWCPDKTLGVLILAAFAAIIALLILGAVS